MTTRASDRDGATYDVNHPLGVDMPRTVAQLRAIADAMEAGRIWPTEIRTEYHAGTDLIPLVEFRVVYAYDRAKMMEDEK